MLILLFYYYYMIIIIDNCPNLLSRPSSQTRTHARDSLSSSSSVIMHDDFEDRNILIESEFKYL